MIILSTKAPNTVTPPHSTTSIPISFCCSANFFLPTRNNYNSSTASHLPSTILSALNINSTTPSNNSPQATFSIRSQTRYAYSKKNSKPMNCQFNFFTTLPIVPLPKNGSKTHSPSLLEIQIIHPKNCSDI